MDKTDFVMDCFVEAINSADLEPLDADDVPVHLRVGDQRECPQYRWKIKKRNCRDRLVHFENRLPKKLPPSYRSLVCRYAFPAFEVGPLMLFANTGEDVYWELRTRVFADRHMSGLLLHNGFLQFGNPCFYDYDPVCFDTSRSLDNEYPIVQIDHEAVLCHSEIRVVNEISCSFLSFAEQFLRMNPRHTWGKET